MKDIRLFRAGFCLWIFLANFGYGMPVAGQDNRTASLKPFECKVSIGAMFKLNEEQMAMGIVPALDVRYFIKPRLAILGRYQLTAYEALGLQPMIDNESFTISSIMLGVLNRNRAERHAFYWGAMGGLATTKEYIGNDADGYAMYGNKKGYGVIQPFVGYAFHRFEIEALYHLCSAREPSYFAVGLGYRFWGGPVKGR